MSSLDLELARHALSTARRLGFGEVELSVGEDRFSACFGPILSNRPAATSAAASVASDNVVPITSSLVGYYAAADPPLAEGTLVKEGQVVAMIAALGITNEIESKVSGEVVEMLVQPGQPVEFGQPLALVRIL